MNLEEQARELEEAKKRNIIDSNRRKMLYADAEAEMIRQEKHVEAVKIFCMLVQRYNINGDDIYQLLDNVPYV